MADFGLARYVIDDQYTSNGGAKFPIKWSPPEVLNYTRFSSKSDVWAFGVLCWEVFTCGDMPYGRAKNPEVVDRVQKGQVLSRPQNCPHPIYEVSFVKYYTLLRPLCSEIFFPFSYFRSCAYVGQQIPMTDLHFANSKKS